MATAAAELFARQGYEQTTVAQIAASAGVTEMTFFRYFPAKEDAIITDPYDPLIAEAVARQPAELGPVVRVVRGMRAVWRDMPEEATALVRTRLRIVAGTPSLRAGTWRAMSATEQEIAGALIATGTDPLAATGSCGCCAGRCRDCALRLGSGNRRSARDGRTGTHPPRPSRRRRRTVR